MLIHTVNFETSQVDPKNGNKDGLPEFTFIGRSNVGKSSLINLLVNRRHLAKTSVTPGKTLTINYFLINNAWYLVDLPGYGYTKISRSQSKSLSPMVETYLKNSDQLITTFILIDSRLEPQPMDRNFINWMGEQSLPFSIVFTKIDKISKNELQASHNRWKKTLSETWDELPLFFFVSALHRTGHEEILSYLNTLLSKKT